MTFQESHYSVQCSQNSEIGNSIISAGSRCHNWPHFLSQHLSRVGRGGRGKSKDWILPWTAKPEDRTEAARPPASYSRAHCSCGCLLQGALPLGSWGQEGGAVSFSFRQPQNSMPTLCPAFPSGVISSGSRFAASAAPCQLLFPLPRGHSLWVWGPQFPENHGLRMPLSPEGPAFLLPSP